MPTPVPNLTTEQLRTLNAESRNLFIQSRMDEHPEEFRKLFRKYAADAREFFVGSDFLRCVDAALLSGSVKMMDVARYLSAPPVSQDDPSTLIDRNPGRKNRLSEEEATRAVKVFYATVNRDLCPWLDDGRSPTEAQESAVVASIATIMAVERFRTKRRNDSSQGQEAEVKAMLLDVGLTHVSVKGNRLLIHEDIPNGTFAGETYIANKKCDIPIKLWDGRMLALECKVSNSERNGWKRLKAEVVSKSFEWQKWGERTGVETLTGAIVSGMFDHTCLIVTHHEIKVALFWQHRLDMLRNFVEATR